MDLLIPIGLQLLALYLGLVGTFVGLAMMVGGPRRAAAAARWALVNPLQKFLGSLVAVANRSLASIWRVSVSAIDGLLKRLNLVVTAILFPRRG